jgi:hypothetical protein
VIERDVIDGIGMVDIGIHNLKCIDEIIFY